MSDYFNRRDMAAVSAFTDPAALFDFGFESKTQFVYDESGDTTYELSFDGINVHATVESTGPIKTREWVDHPRRRLYVRRQAASGGAGAKFVQVMAD